MRKKILLYISMLCLSFVMLFSACNGEGDSPKVDKIEPPKEEITLEKTDVTLCIGDEMYIIPDGASNTALKVIFVSADPNVATIDENGLLTAQNVGQTTITVNYGTSSTSCTVKVGSGNYLPSIAFSHVAGDEIQVSMVDKVNLASYVNFNGKQFEDATFTYQLDESFGRVDNGFFIPAKEGETTLTVQGAWRGFEGITLQKTFNVKIVSAFEFYVNDGSYAYSIHNRESVGTAYYGKAEIPFNVYCFENGKALEATVKVTEGTDVIAYDAQTKTLKVLNENTGDAKVVVTTTDGNGTIYTLVLRISVYASAPEGAGYFNPSWVIEKEDIGYFNPDWLED